MHFDNFSFGTLQIDGRTYEHWCDWKTPVKRYFQLRLDGADFAVLGEGLSLAV